MTELIFPHDSLNLVVLVFLRHDIPRFLDRRSVDFGNACGELTELDDSGERAVREWDGAGGGGEAVGEWGEGAGEVAGAELFDRAGEKLGGAGEGSGEEAGGAGESLGEEAGGAGDGAEKEAAGADEGAGGEKAGGKKEEVGGWTGRLGTFVVVSLGRSLGRLSSCSKEKLSMSITLP